MDECSLYYYLRLTITYQNPNDQGSQVLMTRHSLLDLAYILNLLTHDREATSDFNIVLQIVLLFHSIVLFFSLFILFYAIWK